MKKHIIFLSIGLWITGVAHAQHPIFTAHDSIDVNNISSWVNVHGNLWESTDTNIFSGNINGYQHPVCTYPQGSNKGIAFCGSLWISGLDANNDLHLSAEQYESGDRVDFWPGPAGAPAGTTASYQNSSDWARFWKLNKSSLDSFLALSIHTIANTPATILEWPAKGNPNAKGTNGVSLTISYDMAPFIDANGDGNYNALDGDYPLMRGDQMIWWVHNDYGFTHSQTDAYPLGVEVYCTAFAYHTGGVGDNIQFFDFSVHNKSTLDYHSLRLAFKADMDLGYPFDDFVGYDSTHRMGIVYNHTDSDILYGLNPPTAGIAIIQCTGDGPNGSSLIPMSSFTYYVNTSFIALGDPTNSIETNFYMHSKKRDGTSETSSTGGYIFADDPSSGGTNNECALNDSDRDRRFVISSADMNLPSQGSASMAIALVVTPNGSYCPDASFTAINTVADSAFALYYSHPSAIVTPVVSAAKLMLYPNPAKDVVHVSLVGNITTTENISVHDVLGKAISIPATKTGNEYQLQTTTLTPGIYQVQVTANGQVWNSRFTK